MAQTIAMEVLDKALDKESYEWMAAHASEILEAVEAEVGAGRTPGQIRLFVIRRTGREELASRCEQAARYIQAMVK